MTPLQTTVRAVTSLPVWTTVLRATVLLGLVVLARAAAGQDRVEFLNGTELTGKILEIRKPAKEFDFECTIAGKQVTQTLAYANVHAVTIAGDRFVITPKPASPDPATAGTAGSADRTPADVRKVIDGVGRSDPDWLATTPLNHPASLDLAWPLTAAGPWNESKNVGQYLWGRVYPNVSQWRSGTKLVYHCLSLHKGDAARTRRDMETLGEIYFQLFQDYARAAYWLEKAGVAADAEPGIHLAECYWRLGSKPMALKALDTRQAHLTAIKLFGDMGEVDKALQVTSLYERTSLFNEAWINAGDALRAAGRLDQAVAYYQKVLTRNQARNQEYLDRFKGRASEAIEAIRLFDRADVGRVADGTYTASATGYNGQLEVQVAVRDAKITDVRVTKHREKQFYAALTDTPKQILDGQGIRDVDGTSGATITSQAIVNATARALAKGAK